MKNKFKHKNIMIYGMSVSGIWCAKLVKKLKANIFLFDDNQEKLCNVGIKKATILQKIDEDTITSMDYLIVSPSIEKDNFAIRYAKKHNVYVFSELEFASQFSNNILAITGTNGKTTTVELITDMLNTQKKAVACGNIGYPLSRAVLQNKKHIKVAEVSSFMLENCKSFSPNIATVLNIKPDHLIRHKTMEEYSNLKLSLFKNQKSCDFAVVNLDEKLNIKANAKILTYSQTSHADVRVKDGAIYLFQQKIADINELQLKGKHNISNAMCAICYAHALGIKPENIRQALLNFKPQSFRNEHIATINGVNFINDSKSTNIASTIASVNSTKGAIVLLLGGSKKELDYQELFSSLSKRVKHIVAFGEIAEDIKTANQEIFSIEVTKDLYSAFDVAITLTKKGDTVLFSPSSASYDQFKNYIERGQAFNKKVKDYEFAQTQR